MIYKQTEVQIADNSGGLIGVCISNPRKKKVARIGDIIVVAIKKSTSKNQQTRKNIKINQGDVKKALIVNTTKEMRRTNGSYIKFNENAVILLTENNQPFGSRIYNALPYELRKLGFLKLLSLAPFSI